MCAIHIAEIRVAVLGAEGIELSVVEGIEALGAELEVSALAEGKGLVEVGSEIGAAGTNNSVSAGISTWRRSASGPTTAGLARRP